MYLNTLTGAFHLPCTGARVSHIDARDIARTAAHVLATRQHDGRAYTLTGPEALTFDEVASLLTEATGRPIRYVPVADEQSRAEMIAADVPATYTDMLIKQDRYTREGHNAEVTSAVEYLTGRPPTRFADFTRQHAQRWQT